MRARKHHKEDSDIVPLDSSTAAWLARLERITNTPAAEIVASMLRDIRIDDERAHRRSYAKPNFETAH